MAPRRDASIRRAKAEGSASRGRVNDGIYGGDDGGYSSDGSSRSEELSDCGEGDGDATGLPASRDLALIEVDYERFEGSYW